MKLKTSELTGAALDWAVCSIEGEALSKYTQYSTDWAQGGAIIEREKLVVGWAGNFWMAYIRADDDIVGSGQTPLIAAMRCYVASKLGDEVEVPDEVA